jgi:hypothetical protein
MGTTNALSGAYHLAGALTQHPSSPSTAFAQYSSIMQPLASQAQKLAPGVVGFLNPQTRLGIAGLYLFMLFIQYSGLATLLFLAMGKKENHEPVREYGFREVRELEDGRKA